MCKVEKELTITGEGKEDIIKSIHKCAKFLKKKAKKGKYCRFFAYVSYNDAETNTDIHKSFHKEITGLTEFVKDALSKIETEKEIKNFYVSFNAVKKL